MEQLAEGSGIEFESVIKNGAILKPFASSLEKGVREQLQNGGPLGGYKYPVTDVKITLVDGKMHSVDSKDITFQPAGKEAVEAASQRGKLRLLHPINLVTFLVEDNLKGGDVGSIVPRNEG